MTIKDIFENDNAPYVLFVTSEWCPKCKMQKCMIEDTNIQNKINMKILDVDKNKEIVSTLNIRGIPVFMVFDQNEKEIGRYQELTELTKSLNIS
jgi:thiol-disulfide isomerase/thioredoxin